MVRKLVAAVAVLVVLAATGTPAEAAGIATHAWMGLLAIDHVADPDLAALLDAHRGQVEGGGQYPDSGYLNATLGVPGGDYGEEAHWQRFLDAYLEQIRSRDDCGDLTDPDGPCADEIAHLMGMAAHSIGDQVWDWLFEPYAPQYGEEYLPPELAAFVGPGGIEFQMDMVAIHRHGRWTSPDTPPLPSPADLEAAFHAVGRTDITQAGLVAGKTNSKIIRDAEGALAPTHAPLVEEAMPWTSANFVTAPGGVEWGAVAIAGLYDNLWQRLLGNQPDTEVSITYPADGQTDIPSTGWTGNFGAGSHPGRGRADTRIAAVLTYSRPYVPLATGPGSVPQQLPAGSMTLTDTGTGDPVPLKPGYPRSVPYGADAGEHMIALQPAGDLTPCTTYEVAVTDALLDADLRPVVPTSWRFTTDGCPPPSSTTTTSTTTTSSTSTSTTTSTTTPGSTTTSSTSTTSTSTTSSTSTTAPGSTTTTGSGPTTTGPPGPSSTADGDPTGDPAAVQAAAAARPVTATPRFTG